MPQSPSPSLAPCPFCGGEATLEAQFGREWWVQCESGHSTGIVHSSPAEAEEEWNRRAAPAVEALGQAEPVRLRWRLDESAAALLHTMTGSDDAEEATPVTLFVGESRDDDGNPVYGLHAYESEYPEEGVTPLVEYASPAALGQQEAGSAPGTSCDGCGSTGPRAWALLCDSCMARIRACAPSPTPPSVPDGVSTAQPLSGETEGQRMEVVAAWNDLPAALKAHPAMEPLYRALGGIGMERVQPRAHGVPGIPPAAPPEIERLARAYGQACHKAKSKEAMDAALRELLGALGVSGTDHQTFAPTAPDGGKP